MPSEPLRYKQNRLQQLRGFCEAARQGSISRAAEHLYLSQPSVSLQIRALEEEFGVRLFERSGPKIRLTPDGELLYDLSQDLVEQMDRLREEFLMQRDNLARGRLDIAAGGSTLLYVLPDFVQSFMEAYPGVEVKLHTVTGKAGLALLRAGEVDFAVGPLFETPSDLDFHPFVSYEPVLITSQGHPLASLEPLSLDAISSYPLILPPREQSTWRVVELVFAEHQLAHQVRLEVGGWPVIKKYVSIGLGVSIVMSICLRDDDQLEVRPVGQWFPKRTYGVVLKKGRHLSRQARHFVHLLDPDIALEQ